MRLHLHNNFAYFKPFCISHAIFISSFLYTTINQTGLLRLEERRQPTRIASFGKSPPACLSLLTDPGCRHDHPCHNIFCEDTPLPLSSWLLGSWTRDGFYPLAACHGCRTRTPTAGQIPAIGAGSVYFRILCFYFCCVFASANTEFGDGDGK